MTRVKICGITNLVDARAAVKAGADAVGFVFAPSPRQVTSHTVATIRGQLEDKVAVVGVFVDECPTEIARIAQFCSLDFCQVHGKITEAHQSILGERLIPAITVGRDDSLSTVRSHAGRTVLLDALHLTRANLETLPFDWSLAHQANAICKVILAGGLNSENVQQALEAVRPYAVDVSSGIENRPGVKDHDKLLLFMQRIRTWDSRTNAGTSVSSADDLFLKR